MDLHVLLERASTDLVPAPTLLRDVRNGGRRRVRRRRTAAVAAMLAVTATGVTVPLMLRSPEQATVTFAGTLFDGRAHGDLASDLAYREQVLAAWNASHTSSQNTSRGIFDDLRGAPRVVWAGTTPAGPAAVVVQDAYLHHHEDIQLDHEGIYQLLGFVGPGKNGRPAVVADTYPAPGVSTDIGWYVDPARHVVAALDTGKPVGISYGWIYHSDGAVTRTYSLMTTHDGVAWQQVPTGTVPNQSVHLGLLPVTGNEDVRGILNSVYQSSPGERRLPWSEVTGRRLFALGGSWHPSDGDLSGRWEGALNARRAGGESFSTGFSTWFAYGTTPDGRQLVVGEMQLENDPSHLYAVLGSGTSQQVVSPGAVDPSAILPVAVHLPDGQGWVVAQYHAKLEYRIGRGPWTLVGQDAGLLPAGATSLRVTLPGGTSNVVALGSS